MLTLVKKIELFDILFVSFVASKRRMGLTPLMKFLTHLGDGPLWIVLSLALLVLHPHGTTIVIHLAFAYAMELSIYKLSKSFLPRLRPCDFLPRVSRLVIAPDRYSFPSGHTAAAFVMVTILAHFVPTLVPIFLTVAVGIGFSRIYLGVHYPTDVFVGGVLGFLSGELSIMLTKLLIS